jgi:RHS repeat-associated protein
MKTQFNVSRMSKQTTAAHRGHHRDNILTASRHSRRKQHRTKYVYDAGGNLSERTNNALMQRFNVNSLNELTTVTNGGRLTVAGSTTSPATNVTINTSNAVLYADITFASTNQPWANGNNTYAAIAMDVYGRRSTNALTVSLSGTNNYSYDLNGNLLSDGTRNFGYDDENELISVWQANAWSNNFVYDGKMRRRIERDYSWNGSSFIETNEVHFIYDGNVVVQDRNASNLPTVTYTRGNDLSGTLQGAGGIGGLLARTSNSQLITSQPFASALYHTDGNGNVTCLMYTNGLLAAKYLYDPLGNTLAQYGSLASINNYRFSSKEWNASSGLYYYLYRFYDPNLQRWLNRDPIQEKGGLNLYAFVKNEEINQFDPLGYSGMTTWAARPCEGGTTIRYIQVVFGGNLADVLLSLRFGGFPRVDNGNGSTPYYPYTIPLVGRPGTSSALFQDTPNAFSSCVTFEVCRVCVQNGQIVHIGPCKRWHVMTTDQNLNGSGYPTHPFPSFEFIQILNAQFPGVLPPMYAPDLFPMG